MSMQHILSNKDESHYLAEGFSLGEKISELHSCRCGAAEIDQDCDCPGYDRHSILTYSVVRDCDSKVIGSIEVHDSNGVASEPSLGKFDAPVWHVRCVDDHQAELFYNKKKLCEVSSDFFHELNDEPHKCGVVIDGHNFYVRGPGQEPATKFYWFVGDYPAAEWAHEERMFYDEQTARAYGAHLHVHYSKEYGIDIDPIEGFTTPYRSLNCTVPGCRDSNVVIARL